MILTWDGCPRFGIRDFTVEVSEDGGGTWTEWATDLTEPQVEFIGTPGATYDIRVTAYDNVNNTESTLKADLKAE